MEQTILDFFAKSSELILHNRLPSHQSRSDPLSATNRTRFQLSFDRKVDFASQLASEWNTQPEKLLVIEFFVRSKSTNEKFLAEQWFFQINTGSQRNLKDTIDSPSTLYKRLSILLRTISLLTVTLPLYEKVVRERGSSSLSQSLIIEYSISYTNDTLSSWHPTVDKDNDLTEYSASEFVLPGRAFSFKVKYSKSLRFLQDEIEDEFEHVEDEEVVAPVKKISLVRRACSDNIYNKDMRVLDFEFLDDDSLPNGNPFADEEETYCSSQVESDNIRKRINSEITCKRDLAPRVWDMSKVLDASKLKIKSLESESFGEGDIFLCENDEDKFTQVLSWKDVSMRNQSPTGTTFKEQDTDGSSYLPLLKQLSEDSDKSKMRISVGNMKAVEKLVEQSHDDKVAELLCSIQDLKTLAKRRESGRLEEVREEMHESRVETTSSGKGLRFECGLKRKRGLDREILDPFRDMDELKQLYLQIKRYESRK